MIRFDNTSPITHAIKQIYLLLKWRSKYSDTSWNRYLLNVSWFNPAFNRKWALKLHLKARKVSWTDLGGWNNLKRESTGGKHFRWNNFHYFCKKLKEMISTSQLEKVIANRMHSIKSQITLGSLLKR